MPRKAAPALQDLAERMRPLHARLLRRKRTVATGESCTAGLLSAVLTSHAGSSTFFLGGAVAYADEAKTNLADVAPQLIAGHGAVSSVVAQALAAGSRRRLGADIGLGVTGIAGPGGATPGKPVGLVYVAVDSDHHSKVRKAQLGFDRDGNRRATVGLALDLLEEALSE
jgi:nicotinamide-nucleotide amidase